MSWVPIDGASGPPVPPPPPPQPPPVLGPVGPPPQRKGRRWGLVAGIAAAVVVVVVGVAVVLAPAGDDGEASPEPPSTTGPADLSESSVGNASQAFAVALRQLEEGGSFRYSGVVHAAEATSLRPTRVFAAPLAVEGEVQLPRRVHEVASDGSDTIYESVMVGPGFWERTASAEIGPSSATPYGEGQRGALNLGAAQLPGWLLAVTDRTVVERAEAEALGVGGDLRVFGGALTLDEVGGTLEMFIALDADDVLTRVWIASADAPFFVDWEILDIGVPQDIAAPGALPDAVVGFGTDELAAAGIAQPVQLTQVPAGWVLAEAWLEPDAPGAGCSTLNLDYQPVDANRDRDGNPEPITRIDTAFQLDVIAAACEPPGDPTGISNPVDVGPWTGSEWTSWTSESNQEWYQGSVSDGTTTLRYLTNLPFEDVEVLLGSVAPFDPQAQPAELAQG